MKARILIVDDEPTVRDVVGRYLRREGYETLLAANGEEGVERSADADAGIVRPRKIRVEAAVEEELLVVRLRHGEAERVLERSAVGIADRHGHAQRVEAFRDRDPDPGGARRVNETDQRRGCHGAGVTAT